VKNKDLPAFDSFPIDINKGIYSHGLSKREFAVIQIAQGLLVSETDTYYYRTQIDDKGNVIKTRHQLIAEEAIKCVDAVFETMEKSN
jgi:DNA-binding CsgD family transcriptional regulator